MKLLVNGALPPENNATDIAIIGMSCRFPGNVNSPDELWEFLLKEGDGITPIPTNRWNNSAYYDQDKEKKGKIYIDKGGFVKNIDQFDPLFFGISPKEAPYIDPQHRWLLELTYEAFENAGLKISEYKGSDTAVYIGQFVHDYEQIQTDMSARNEISTHSATGASTTLTSNRISYAFDFIGPSLTLDTACSSSLVAIDSACNALINNNCNLAIAGGVNIILRPEFTMMICKASMLSPDGYCKSFDASANGYVRSEGAGIVLLKKLTDAIKDRDTILAVIKATGVNQDGQTNGITVPNGESQKKLLVQTMNRAGVQSDDIQYVEAHGTGTAVGDPIEVNALGSILGNRSQIKAPCIIGSIKSNIGHTEAAAGMAGLIKTVLSINNGVIPKNLHFHNINPLIDPQKLNIKIASQQVDWPDTEGYPKTAIVNSFGFGGTNSNLVLREFQKQERTEDIGNATILDTNLLIISGKNDNALIDNTKKYIDFLEKKANISNEEIENIYYSNNVKREHHQHRLISHGNTIQDHIEALKKSISNETDTTYVKGIVKKLKNKKISFVYSGMGTQWARMGKDLFDKEKIFREALIKCDKALSKYTNYSLIDKIFNGESIDQTDIAQPAIFAIQVAITEQLKHWGIIPDAIVGHSAGEVAASYIAGALSFEDAIKVIYHRSRLQQTTEGTGKMLAVGMDVNELQKHIEGYEKAISIAAINSKNAITLSGDENALIKISQKLDNDGIFARFLKVDVPYHSPTMDQLKTPLIKALHGINPLNPTVKLYSTVSGKISNEKDWGPEYWANNVREPVLFESAIQNMIDEDLNIFIEISANPALTSSIQNILKQNNTDGVCIDIMKRNHNNENSLINVLMKLHAHGLELDWDYLYPTPKTLVSLPNYAWQHQTYWNESESGRKSRINNIVQLSNFKDKKHPILGSQFNSKINIWQNNIEEGFSSLKYIDDHRVNNETIFPGAAYVEIGLAVANQIDQQQILSLHDVVFEKAMFVNINMALQIETILSDDKKHFSINAIDQNTNEWSRYCHGTIGINHEHQFKTYDIEKIKKSLVNSYTRDTFYRHCAQLGLTYLDQFQHINQVWFNNVDAISEINLLAIEKNLDKDYLLHPIFLDNAFQTIFPTLKIGYLPTKITDIYFHKKPYGKCYAYVRTEFKDSEKAIGSLLILSENGEIFVEMTGIELTAIKENRNPSDNELLYDYTWLKSDIDITVENREVYNWILFSDENESCKEIQHQLLNNSNKIYSIEKGNSNNKLDNYRYLTKAESMEDFLWIFKDLEMESSGIIYCWNLTSSIEDTVTSESAMKKCLTATITPTYIIQAFNKISWEKEQNIFFLTQSAFSIDPHDIPANPVQGSLWGLVRVMASEYPEHQFSIVDLPDHFAQNTVNQLINQITHGQYEQELAIRSSGYYSHRLRRIDDAIYNEYKKRPCVDMDNFRYQLTFNNNNEITINGCLKPPITKDELQVCILKSAHTDSFEFGIYSGIITNKGLKTDNDMQIGNRIIFYSFDKPSTHMAIKNSQIINCSANLEIIIYAIRYVSLSEFYVQKIANLQSNDTVLLHHTNTLVDISIRDALIERGINNICKDDFFHSRNENAPKLIVNGHISNSLSDIAKNLSSYGYLIDIHGSKEKLDASVFQEMASRNILYCHVYYKDFINRNFHSLKKTISNIVDKLNKTDIKNWINQYTNVVQLNDIESSKKSITQDRISLIDWQNHPHYANFETNVDIVKPDKSYLITGGSGGLGLATMEWLIEKGAKTIILTSRSNVSDLVSKKIQIFKNKGIDIQYIPCDISQEKEVFHLIKNINNDTPLAGIFHAAGVLNDGIIDKQTYDKFYKTMAPKVMGAWNLHKACLDIKLDFLVFFSSIASIVGWAGQSNYAASNLFMETLAHRRIKQGLPASVINWGPWSEVGMAASMTQIDINRMNESGMRFITPDIGLKNMEILLGNYVIQAGIFDLDWKKIRTVFPNHKNKSLFSHFFDDELEQKSDDFFILYKKINDVDKKQYLLTIIKSILSDVLGVQDPESIDENTSVFDYGLNSLMALEFKNKLQAKIKTPLPATLALKYHSPSVMLEPIIDLIQKEITNNYVNENEAVTYW